MISVYPTNFPPSNTPIVDAQGNMSIPGMSFLRAIFNRTGQDNGLAIQIGNNIPAASGTPATATPLTADWNLITSGAFGGGVTLPALTGGQMVMVQNNSGSGITVYGPIDGGTSYSLANTKMQIFWFFSSSQAVSTQLG